MIRNCCFDFIQTQWTILRTPSGCCSRITSFVLLLFPGTVCAILGSLVFLVGRICCCKRDQLPPAGAATDEVAKRTFKQRRLSMPEIGVTSTPESALTSRETLAKPLEGPTRSFARRLSLPNQQRATLEYDHRSRLIETSIRLARSPGHSRSNSTASTGDANCLPLNTYRTIVMRLQEACNATSKTLETKSQDKNLNDAQLKNLFDRLLRVQCALKNLGDMNDNQAREEDVHIQDLNALTDWYHNGLKAWCEENYCSINVESLNLADINLGSQTDYVSTLMNALTHCSELDLSDTHLSALPDLSKTTLKVLYLQDVSELMTPGKLELKEDQRNHLPKGCQVHFERLKSHNVN